MAERGNRCTCSTRHHRQHGGCGQQAQHRRRTDPRSKRSVIADPHAPPPTACARDAAAGKAAVSHMPVKRSSVCVWGGGGAGKTGGRPRPVSLFPLAGWLAG